MYFIERLLEANHLFAHLNPLLPLDYKSSTEDHNMKAVREGNCQFYFPYLKQQEGCQCTSGDVCVVIINVILLSGERNYFCSKMMENGI
jgi:hypothetical protein